MKVFLSSITTFLQWYFFFDIKSSSKYKWMDEWNMITIIIIINSLFKEGYKVS